MITTILTIALYMALLIVLIIASKQRQERRWTPCSWCKRYASQWGEIVPLHQVPFDEEISNSHGICPECAAVVREELAQVNFRMRHGAAGDPPTGS